MWHEPTACLSPLWLALQEQLLPSQCLPGVSAELLWLLFSILISTNPVSLTLTVEIPQPALQDASKPTILDHTENMIVPGAQVIPLWAVTAS